MLPRRAFVAADHIPLDIFLLFIFTTYASDDFFFFTRRRRGFGLLFRGFVLRLCLGRFAPLWGFLDQIQVLVLAFCGAS